MDVQELRQKTAKELNDMLLIEQEKFRDLRFKASSRQLKNVRALRQTKQNIAQIMTILGEIQAKAQNA